MSQVTHVCCFVCVRLCLCLCLCLRLRLRLCLLQAAVAEDEAFWGVVKHVKIWARMSPEDKVVLQCVAVCCVVVCCSVWQSVAMCWQRVEMFCNLLQWVHMTPEDKVVLQCVAVCARVPRG